MRRITERIRYLCPNARLIFALTTEVVEPGFEPGPALGERKNSDIQRYNEIAKGVFAELDIEINDLWSVSKALSKDAHSDMVHFETEMGIRILGDQVVRCLEKYCG